MAKVQKLFELQQTIAFTEYDFYKIYAKTFKSSDLGRVKTLLALRKKAGIFGLIDENPKRDRVKRGKKPYFDAEGKVALMFLKMYTNLSAPKLMEALNGNIHYQIFCGVRINPANPLTNYKLIDDTILERQMLFCLLSGRQRRWRWQPKSIQFSKLPGSIVSRHEQK